MADLASEAQRDPDAIKRSIAWSGDSLVVTFRDDAGNPVFVHTNPTIPAGSLSAPWAAVIEKAYCVFRGSRGSTPGPNTYASTNWGFPDAASRALGFTLVGSFTHSLPSVYVWDQLVTHVATLGEPVVFSTSGIDSILVVNHVYSVTGVYADAGGPHVVVRNPWGFDATCPAGSSGSSWDDGVVTLTLDQFMSAAYWTYFLR
jgi:hypothetical protein